MITGGSQGIGLACARSCLRAGARVTIAARGVEFLNTARESFQTEGFGSDIFSVTCDVSKDEDISRLYDSAQTKFGDIKGVIHAAAILGAIGKITDVDSLAWWETVRVNLYGSFLVMREAARRMIASGGGRIVTFAGGGASYPFPNYTAYAVGKAALVRFVETAAIELAPANIEINAVSPGFVITKMHQSTIAAGPSAASAEYFERTKAEIQSGGIPPEIGANVATFLITSAAQGITGKLVAAQYDNVSNWSQHLAELRDTDIFTLRRILPKDRGMSWQ